MHEEIVKFKSFDEYFNGDNFFSYNQLFKDKDFSKKTYKYGYDTSSLALKKRFVSEALGFSIKEDDYNRANDMLDQIHILEYEEYLQKLEVEFNKFDPSKKLFKRLKKVYLVQIRQLMDERSLFVYPYTEFAQYFLNSSNNLEELLEEFEENYDIWLGKLVTMGHLTDFIGVTPGIFPILFFEKDSNEENTQILKNFEIAWNSLWDDFTYDEIGRKAASLLDTSLYRAFPELNLISITPYEGAECKGYLLINEEKPDVKLSIHVHLNEHKRIRKLLEVSDRDLILLVKPYTLIVYGFKVRKSKNEKFNGTLIEFKSKLSWHCSIDNTPIFQSDNFQIKLPFNDTNDTVPIENAICNVFKNSNEEVTDKDINLLIDLVLAAKEQKKGTILVILEKKIAKSEAKKLTQSSTLIVPKKLQAQLIKRFSGIDGAIIVDTKGICHAFGVILDGDITEGDPGRGARFNSAHRYFATKKKQDIPCFLVVVSEDGHISILPDEIGH
ncbi:diadenylate cyclase [Peribacillus butanolivorans]|uniref:diadenylate cyclase n=1 Tax=Peribacillus butanolivorans TaxID=421767 RepID=UPI00368DE3E5